MSVMKENVDVNELLDKLSHNESGLVTSQIATAFYFSKSCIDLVQDAANKLKMQYDNAAGGDKSRLHSKLIARNLQITVKALCSMKEVLHKSLTAYCPTNNLKEVNESNGLSSELIGAVQSVMNRLIDDRLLDCKFINEPDVAAIHFLNERHDNLLAELLVVKEECIKLHYSGALPSLLSLIATLRFAEKRVDFHAQLMKEALSISGNTGYDMDSFAYGSTPFTSWLRIITTPAVSDALATLHVDGRKSFMVWGSSSGWLVFYAALTLNKVPCIGFEILPCLCQLAQQVAGEVGVTGTEFVCDDMLHADLQSVGVLMLANMCWDKELMAKVSEKISLELREGSLLIEYTGHFREYSGLSNLAHLEVPVSWNASQNIYLYQRSTGLMGRQ